MALNFTPRDFENTYYLIRVIVNYWDFRIL